MMSHEEQQAQSESVKNIEAFLNAIKKWWPYVAILCSIFGAIIAGTFWVVSGFYNYDNRNKAAYATKQDVQNVNDKLDKLMTAVTYQGLQARENHNKDSLNAVEIKRTVIENKQQMDNKFTEIKKQLGSWSFYTQKWNADHTKRIAIPFN